MRRTILRVLGFPALAAALAGLATLAPESSAPGRPPTVVPVAQTAYACPAGGSITVAAGQLHAGTAADARAFPSGAPQDRLADPSVWRAAVVAGDGVVVRQEGTASGAVGFFAGAAGRNAGGGLVVGACTGVFDDAWYVGLGSGGRHQSTLILSNLTGSPAAVDLQVWGVGGPVEAVGAEGVLVPPGATRRIRLDALAAGEQELALRVHRRRGSLAAVVNDSSTATFAGTEPVAAGAPPARRQIVGGIVPGARGRTLLLVNPGEDSARVGVEAIGADGAVALEGLDQVRVPAGTVRAVAIPAAAGAGALAIRTTSDRPVSAVVRMAPTTKDYAVAEAAEPLAGAAIVPIAWGRTAVPRHLILTAPGKAASVRVVAYDARMRSLATATVEIPAETTRAVAARRLFRGFSPAYLVLAPEGDVVAAATYAGAGGGISSLALSAAPVSVLGPQVRRVD